MSGPRPEPVEGPTRLRLSRAKGFDLQAHSRAVNGLPAVNVARPSTFGNPFLVGKDGDRVYCVDLFRYMMGGLYALSCAPPVEEQREVRAAILANLPKLRGKNFACWCALDGKPCHADVLLALATGPICEEVKPSPLMARAQPASRPKKSSVENAPATERSMTRLNICVCCRPDAGWPSGKGKGAITPGAGSNPAPATKLLARHLPILSDRVAELGDFISALQEWGCEEPQEMADHIRDFLHSTEGLRAYLDRGLRVIEGGGEGAPRGCRRADVDIGTID